MEDSEIISLLEKRDESGLKLLEEKYGAAMRGIARGVLRREDDAEECVNDGLLAVWNAIPPEKPVSLKAYAAKIARRLALNRIEKAEAGKRSAVLVELDEIAEASSVSFEEELVESSALSDTVNRYLAGKSKCEAAVFVRRYFSGESGREISRATGLGVSKVSRMLKQMRRELAEELRKEGFEQ